MTNDSATVWAAAGVIVAFVSGACTLTGFIINLMVIKHTEAMNTQFSVHIARLEGKIDSINLSSVNAEVASLREWRHELGPKKMVYDECVDDLHALEKKFAEYCLATERRITALESVE